MVGAAIGACKHVLGSVHLRVTRKLGACGCRCVQACFKVTLFRGTRGPVRAALGARTLTLRWVPVGSRNGRCVRLSLRVRLL